MPMTTIPTSYLATDDRPNDRVVLTVMLAAAEAGRAQQVSTNADDCLRACVAILRGWLDELEPDGLR